MATERVHSKFSPSQTERLRLCLGSANLLERTPQRDRTKYSEEGDVAHAVLEVGLATFCTTGEQAVENSIYCCQEFPKDFYSAITDALHYVWGVMEWLNVNYGDAVLYTEIYVNPPVESAPNQAGGYIDIAIHSKKARLLYVVDYKHGVGITKEALDNAQVTQYAAGLLYGTDSPISPEDVNDVVLAIVQPRAFHAHGPIRESRVNQNTVVEFLRELDGLILAAQQPNATLTPGLEQCQMCEARSTCPALEAKSLAVIHPSLSNIHQLNQRKLPDPRTLDVNRLAYIKHAYDLVALWMRGVNEHIDELIRKGEHVPGWKLVEPRAIRQYYDKIPEAERVQKLSALIGCPKEDLYSVEMKPLTEVEKMVVESFKSRVGRGRRKQAAEEAKKTFAYFTLKKQSDNLSLVPEDDPRPAINRASRAFGDLILPPAPYNGEPQ